ncbi:hypothetical protein AC579_1067 [Pseudocercospora musae]|uniref:Major facilitator superfamily (MFS) profile domain-containing protein n=1 Tax=Pseudocercospora musae TaxID=113226 RepID=A0A139H3V0_9PEZI|nr:hypothetical protein AC579_1067 [Pseudocercospora musae]
MGSNIFKHRSNRSIAGANDFQTLRSSSGISLIQNGQETPRSPSLHSAASFDLGNRQAIYNHSRSTSTTYTNYHDTNIEKQLESGFQPAPADRVVSLNLFPSIGYPSLQQAHQNANPGQSMSDKNASVQQSPGPKIVGPPKQDSGLSPWHERGFIFTICISQLFSLAALAQSFAPLLLIADDFGVTNPGEMAWFTASYSMTLGSFILPAGRLGDMYGHKKIYLIGWIWFAVSSAIAGFSAIAGGHIMLSICRGLQGIAPALLVPNGIALIGRTFPMGPKRARAIALFGGCGPVGMTLGVVFSSLIAQVSWWPGCFWAMAIACVFAFGLSWSIIPSSEGFQKAANMTDFDFWGSLTGVSGLMLLNFVLNQAPIDGWDRAYIPVTLILSLVLLGIFGYVELKVAKAPIIPLQALDRKAVLTMACIGFGWASHGIWAYYLYLFIMVIQGYPPLDAASKTWPVAPIGFCAAIAVPYLLKKLKVPWLMTIAMLVFVVSPGLLIFANPADPFPIPMITSIIIAPLAMNWSFPSGTILMSNALPKEHQGIGASLISTMVNYSIATGLGIGGTIDRYTSHGHTPLHGYHNVWWLGVAFGAAGVVTSLYFVWQSRIPK